MSVRVLVIRPKASNPFIKLSPCRRRAPHQWWWVVPRYWGVQSGYHIRRWYRISSNAHLGAGRPLRCLRWFGLLVGTGSVAEVIPSLHLHPLRSILLELTGDTIIEQSFPSLLSLCPVFPARVPVLYGGWCVRSHARRAGASERIQEAPQLEPWVQCGACAGSG